MPTWNRILIAIACTIISAGVVVSLFVQDFMWLARFGCLLTIFAILGFATAEDVLAFIEKDETYRTWQEHAKPENKVEYNLVWYKKWASQILRFVGLSYRVMRHYPNFLVENYKHSAQMEQDIKTLKRTEIYTGMIGAFLWGWGDLINRFLA